MKFIFIAAALCLGLNAGAQITWDEYNYCTKGYKLVAEDGLTAKVGYEVKGSLPVQLRHGNFATHILKEVATNKIKAIIVTYWRVDNVKHYLCVPCPGKGELAEIILGRCMSEWHATFDGGDEADGEDILFSLSAALIEKGNLK